jgi:small subunit ribosomal protein S17
MPRKTRQKKNIGIPIKPPEKECHGKRCPWHGKISVRGRVLRGEVRSAKSHKTAIVEWDYHRFITKFERYQREKSRVTAHNPLCIRAKEGDRVIIAECRPVSKTKHFVIVGLEKDFRPKAAKPAVEAKK